MQLATSLIFICAVFTASAEASTSTYVVDEVLPLGGKVIPGFGLAVATNGSQSVVTQPNTLTESAGGFLYQVISRKWEDETSFGYSHVEINAGSYLPCNGAAIEGDTVAFGIPDAYDNHGSVDVWQRPSSWYLQELFAPTASSFEEFGCSVSLSGPTLIVGAPGHAGTGAAYVFVQQTDGAWDFQAQLTAFEAVDKDAVGLSVAIDGDLAVLGAPHSKSYTGTVYVFKRTGNVWSEIKQLTATDGLADDQFGASVAISQGTIAIGAPEHNVQHGAVYVVSGANLENEVVLSSSSDKNFGSSVSIYNDRLLVGAMGSNAVYAYTQRGSKWLLRASFSDVSGSLFGGSVAISGTNVVLGSPGVNAAYLLHDDEIFGDDNE